MTATELAAIVVAIASVAAVMLLLFALISVHRTLTTMRLSIEELRREALPVVSELHRTVAQANLELERVDTLLDSVQSVTVTVDSFSRLAYLTFSNPLIKAVAIATGTGRAARALRRG
jgi:uncharacterized protein YoxC